MVQFCTVHLGANEEVKLLKFYKGKNLSHEAKLLPAGIGKAKILSPLWSQKGPLIPILLGLSKQHTHSNQYAEITGAA